MKCIFCRIYGNFSERRKEKRERKNNKKIVKIRIERFKTLAQITASLVVVLSLFSSFYKGDFIKHLNIDSHSIDNNINWIIILTFFLWFVLLAVGVKIALLYDKLADLEFNESKKTPHKSDGCGI